MPTVHRNIFTATYFPYNPGNGCETFAMCLASPPELHWDFGSQAITQVLPADLLRLVSHSGLLSNVTMCFKCAHNNVYMRMHIHAWHAHMAAHSVSEPRVN